MALVSLNSFVNNVHSCLVTVHQMPQIHGAEIFTGQHPLRSYTKAQFEGQLHGTLGHRLVMTNVQLPRVLPW